MVQRSEKTVTAAHTAGMGDILVAETHLDQMCSFHFQTDSCFLLVFLELKRNLTQLLFTSHKALGHSSSKFQQIQSLPFCQR